MYAEFGDRLEQVADWLTKLLLGAGLTQIHSLWTQAPVINKFFADACGFDNRVLGTVIASGALAGGFLLGYAAALLFLPVALQAGVKEVLSIVKSTPRTSAE